MTTEAGYAGGDPSQVLAAARELARQVRRAQRATWFPLLVFAALTFAAIPVDRYGGRTLTCQPVPAPGGGLAGRICSVYSTASAVYWPIGLVLAYAAIAAFYLHRSRARGVGTRVRPYVTAGLIIAILLTGASLWAASHPGAAAGGYGILGLRFQGPSLNLLHRVASPASAIGLALLVLARAERSRALLLLTVGYLVIVLVPITFGWDLLARPTTWAFLPHLVIDGGVLLLGGLGFALAQRPARQPAA